MKIIKLEIYNYRILKNLEIDIEKDLSLIIGKNNCGKTSILSVLNKFIGDKSASNYFKYDDFNLDFKCDLYKFIEQNGSGWNAIKNKGIELYLFIKCEDEDNLSNVNKLMLDLDPKNNIIVIKFEYNLSIEKMSSLVESFNQYFDRFLAKGKTCINKETCFDNFMKLKHRMFFEIKKKTLLFDTTINKPSENEYRIIDPKVVNLDRIISFKYISARRDTINSDSDGTLSSLSTRYYEKTQTDDSNPTIQDFECI